MKKNITILSFLWLFLAALPALADSTNALTGTYYGTADITSPTFLGTIDLALYLDVTGTSIQQSTSYVIMDKTLIYPAVAPQINAKDVGPRVSGTLSTTSFSLTTPVVFPSIVGDKVALRSFTLKNTSVANVGTSLSGDYEETITGLGPDPLVIKGKFILVKPTAIVTELSLKPNSSGCIDLAGIRAGGSDPNVVE